MSNVPSPTELTEKQAQRRQRVIDAAIKLASEGGYEAVQMRDVATEADVALGTVYRYFSSKDQLLAAAWTEWSRGLETRLSGRPLRGDTPAERLVDFFKRANRALERQPTLTSALVASMTSSDPETIHHQSEVAAMMTRVVLHELEDVDPEVGQRIREVLGHVWYSTLVNWVNGRFSIKRVNEALANATHLLVDSRH